MLLDHYGQDDPEYRAKELTETQEDKWREAINPLKLGVSEQEMCDTADIEQWLWGLYDNTNKPGFAKAAQSAVEAAREHWDHLLLAEQALFDYTPNSEQAPEDDREVPILRKRAGFTRTELNARAGEVCLERLRALQSGSAEVAATSNKLSAKDAMARLKRFQAAIGSPLE